MSPCHITIDTTRLVPAHPDQVLFVTRRTTVPITPFKVLGIAVGTLSGPDPSDRAVVQLTAVAARIGPCSHHTMKLDFVFQTRVKPARPFSALETDWLGYDPEQYRRQPRLPAALHQLQAWTDAFRPDLVAAHHGPHDPYTPHGRCVLPAEILPRHPHWISTFRLAHHAWPANRNAVECAAENVVHDVERCLGLDPQRLTGAALRPLVLLAWQAHDLVEAGHAATPAALGAWSAEVPLLTRVPDGGCCQGCFWKYVPRSVCQQIVETRRDARGRPFAPALEAMVLKTAQAALQGQYAVELPDATPPAGAE